MTLIGQLVRHVFTHSKYVRSQINQEQAKLLATSGITIALSGLTEKTLLPHLNRWQTFHLTKDIDGVDGTIYICISSEDGKLNINKAFDFDKNEIKQAYNSIIRSH